MNYSDAIQALIDTQEVADVLKRGSTAGYEVRSLQTILYELGFATELNWATYRADGDYGGGTTRAVTALIGKNGLSGDGTQVDDAIGRRIVDLYEVKGDLKLLDAAFAAGKAEDLYSREHGDTAHVSGLQRMLHIAGYDEALNWANLGALGMYGDSTALAIKSFGSDVGEPNDGSFLSNALARKLEARVKEKFGDKLELSSSSGSSQRRAGPDVTVQKVSGRTYAMDEYFRVRLRSYKLGYFNAGGEQVKLFANVYKEDLKADGMTDSTLRVILPVSENEGALDAINTWDNSFLSFGMQQWTMGAEGNKGELPALLKKIKTDFPDAFQQYYGKHGIDIIDSETNRVYGYVSLNGTPIKSSSSKTQFRKAEWAFRFWRAGLDPRVKLVELKHAMDRLYRFYHTDRYKVLNKFYVDQLITSEYGVALILDQHVNRPAYVRTDLGKALNNLGMANQDPSSWTTADETKLITAYLKIRRMTDPGPRAAVTQKYVTNGTLSTERNSFQLTEGTRDLNAGFLPAGTSHEDYAGEHLEMGSEHAVPRKDETPAEKKQHFLARMWRFLLGK